LNAEESDEEDRVGPIWSVRGHLSGHPCREAGIEWFLDESTGIMQWGYAPNLWPQGNVLRLDNWGWQIHNPNVVLRSIDPMPSALTIPFSGESEETKLDETKRDCSREKEDIDCIWEDLLHCLENVPLRNAPSVNGFPVTTDLPRAFIGQFV
jgi:hypothetical protein